MNVNDVNNGQINDEVEVHWTEKDLKDEVLNSEPAFSTEIRFIDKSNRCQS